MKETLICSLEKHNIYYLSDANVSFYILVPYKEYDNTNISIRLKSNYDSYDLTKNSLEVVTNELINYYKNLDNYNITLILPVFYNNILDRINFLESRLDYLIKKINIIYSLEEQIYSDMNFDNLTDPKKSKPLIEFNKKLRNTNIND